QAANLPSFTSLHLGTTCLHLSNANGHVVWNVHPDGGLAGLGISPLKMILSLLSVGSGIGTADNNAFVEGCKGSAYNFSLGANSTNLPKYITSTRSLICSITLKSCPIKT